MVNPSSPKSLVLQYLSDQARVGPSTTNGADKPDQMSALEESSPLILFFFFF